MNVIQANLKFKEALIPLKKDKVLFILIHHIDAVTATPEQIHEWHLANGWNGFGYNEYIKKDGTVYIGRGDNIGAQCENMNSKSYGIAVEGNYDQETVMPIAQFSSLIERVKVNKVKFPNFLEVAPHSKYYNTTCPGKYFSMENVYNALTDNRATDIEKAVENVFLAGLISNKNYWINVLKGQEPVNLDYLKIAFSRAKQK